MKLEELTKEELIRLIKDRWWPLPSHRDIITAHWQSMTEEASRIMAQANQESQKYAGIKTFEALKSWSDAQALFDKGLKLSDKAGAVFKELCELNQSPQG